MRQEQVKSLLETVNEGEATIVKILKHPKCRSKVISVKRY